MLPAGTVTFLFTDIEGSTTLWEQMPQAMKASLAQHHAILHKAVSDNCGVVYKIIGDSFQAAFPVTADALLAAVQAQRGLAAETWGETGPLRVRMGLHTGLAIPLENDYDTTHTLNRVARVMSAGHGGQVLLSQETAELVRRELTEGVSLRDLGEHRMKGLAIPEHLYQVLIPGLRQDFPPLATQAEHPHNLPPQLTSFVVREKDTAAVSGLLRRPGVRLVTLTGPGGVGKSRLSIQVGREVLGDFRDGVFFVPLASIQAPDLVPQVILQALGLKEEGRVLPQELVKQALSAKQALLIMDNFEHLLPAASLVGELLAALPGLRVFASSRSPLHLHGEHEYGLNPLSIPSAGDEPLASVSAFEATRLFIERAQAAKADFQPTRQNAQAIIEICQRLDGIPLAIELATARVKVLPPQALLERLSSRLALLTGGARDLPARQQTLRNAIDWSYKLLDEGEKALFARLSIFPGGATLESAEAVCDLSDCSPRAGMTILDTLASLVDKSLLRLEEGLSGVPRYSMLQTVREYALEHLSASQDVSALRSMFVEYFLSVVNQAEAHYYQEDSVDWLKRLSDEQDNLRMALEWCLEGEAVDRQIQRQGAEIAGKLWLFWYYQGRLNEGVRWVELALQRVPESGRFRANALIGAGTLLFQKGEYQKAASMMKEGLDIMQYLEDPLGLAEALHIYGHITLDQGKLDQADQLFQESLEIFRELDDTGHIVTLVGDLGFIAYFRGDTQAARQFYEECIAQSQENNLKDNLAQSLDRLGDLERYSGNYARAEEFYTQSLAFYREQNVRVYAAGILHSLGYLAIRRGDFSLGRAYFLESLGVQREVENKQGIAECLFGLAVLAAWEATEMEACQRAARQFGAAQAYLDLISVPLSPADRLEIEQATEIVRTSITPEDFSAAWEEGRAWRLEQAIQNSKN